MGVTTTPPTWPLAHDDWFSDLDSTEERCRAFLELLRWPDGIVCPRCLAAEVGHIPARRRHYCRCCKYQFSATAGTIFHKSHVPLWKWFLALALMLERDTGLPATQLQRFLGGSYKTSWFLEHRIRAALGGRPGRAGAQASSRVYGSAAGCYRQLALRYLPAYRAEERWREACRGDHDACARSVAALLAADPLAFDELVGRRLTVA